MDRKETENQDRSGSPDEAFETAVTMVGGENDAPPAEAADQSAPAESEKAESPAEATATESEKAEPAAEEEPASTGVTAVTAPPAEGDAPPSPPAPGKGGGLLQPGEKLGKYLIEKRLGKGGMGEVYLAKHEQLNILRAIKVLPRELAKKNSQFFARFLREARTACEIRHSNIVNVMDVETDEERGLSYIVMEYVDGGDVRGLLKNSGRLTVDQALVIVEAVTSALAAASEYGIVHRDIKPDNIMLTKRGEVKLADLGIAKSGDEDVQLTKTNVMMGTPAYLSPEQAKDAKHVDIRADIYSLGATLFEMLTGRIPYQGSSTYDILSKLHTDPVPNPCDFNPDVPPEIGRLTMTMMAKKPEDRYQSAAELLEVLGRSRAHQKTVVEAQKIIREAIQTAYGAESVPPTTTVVRRRRRRAWGRIAIGLCATAIVGMLVWYFYKNPPARVTTIIMPAPAKTAAIVHPVFQLRPAEARITLQAGGQEYAPVKREGGIAVFEAGEGEYVFTASCDGYISQTGTVTVHENYKGEVTLLPAVLTIRTEPGAAVSLALDGKAIQSGTADDTGTISFKGLKAGRYMVEGARRGDRPFREEVFFKGDAEATHMLRLIPSRLSLTLHVTPDKTQALLAREDGAMKPVKATVEATRTFADLAPGDYVLTLSAAGYDDYREIFTLSGNEAKHIALKRTSNRSDRGVIVLRGVMTGDEALDKFIAENGVEVKIKGDSAPWRNVKLPATFDDLKPGTYTLLVRLPAKGIKGQESDEIAVEAGNPTEYEMFLATF